MKYKYNFRTGLKRISAKGFKSKIVTGIAVAMTPAALLLSSGGALAANSTIYNDIPSPTAANYPSEAFEATSTSEFGGQVQFAGTARENPTVTVLMSSWGCESGSWTSACTTTQGSTFTEPITLNIYSVNPDNSPGGLVATTTKTFNIPYRPSTSPVCGDGRWSSDGTIAKCFNGYATPVTFNLTGTTLPNKAIVSVAYNTSHYGTTPYGETTTCFASSGGCGYDSLNVALTGVPTTGSQPLPDDTYANSTWGGAYCDNGLSSTGAFRLDSGCWTGYQPMLKVEAGVKMPTSKDQCMNNGWKDYGSKTKVTV
jgi:hypothetical protein